MTTPITYYEKIAAGDYPGISQDYAMSPGFRHDATGRVINAATEWLREADHSRLVLIAEVANLENRLDDVGSELGSLKAGIFQAGEGAARIGYERARQQRVEGHEVINDVNDYENGILGRAAESYLVAARIGKLRVPPDVWPWDAEVWNPSADPLRNLEKAGALIAAEIDRLQVEVAQKAVDLAESDEFAITEARR